MWASHRFVDRVSPPLVATRIRSRRSVRPGEREESPRQATNVIGVTAEHVLPIAADSLQPCTSRFPAFAFWTSVLRSSCWRFVAAAGS